MRYYIASRLENASQVRELKLQLDAKGWQHTYDWTVHGSVQQEGHARIAEVSELETRGVLDAQVVIVLLAGGRGTHTELGIAIAHAYIDADTHIYLVSADPETDFGDGGKTCAFYHHRFVTRCTPDELQDFIANWQ